MFLLTILLGLSLWGLFNWYSENSKLETIHKHTFKAVYLDEISEQENYFRLISTDVDTFKIIKHYVPELTWEYFENFDFNKALTIESFDLNISKLTIEPNQKLIDINYIEIKREDTKYEALAVITACSIMSLIIGLLIYFLPKLESWTRNKVEQGIMKIKDVRKVKDYLFELEVKGIKALVFHDFNLKISKYGNKSLIKVFLPVSAKEKLHIDKLKVDYFEKKKYYSFIHNIPFSINHWNAKSNQK